ncbi:MAG TPA: hypothetical protein P5136_00550 [Methanofastidiosum sp.]|nr:hypothetical protein [Methanofastidiosum sp.]
MRISIYIPENKEQIYSSLKTEIKDLWFKKYKESLSQNAILIKALVFFRNYLTETLEVEKEYDSQGQIIHQYSRIRS